MAMASVFMLGLFAPNLGFANITNVHHERLRALKQDLNDKRLALRNFHSEEKSLILLIGELDQSLAQIWTSYEEALSRQEVLSTELKQLEAQLATDKEAFDLVSKRLQKRLRAIYVLGKHGAVRHFFGAESFRDLSFRRTLVKKVADQDVTLVNQRATIHRGIEEKRARVAKNLQEAEQLSNQIKEQADLLQTTRLERASTISQIQGKKDLAMRAVREIVSEQQSVKRVMFRLLREKNRKTTPRRLRGVQVLKGGLHWPVQGQIIRVFGVSRDKVTKAKWVSNGIHLRASLGDPIAAPAEGEVVFVGWLKGFGQLVILDHGEGIHSLLAHLSRPIVDKGDVVSRGQSVGFAGDSGSLEGPKLYFELRAKGKPINPLRFLKY
jgi:septal ring factor EnvC (AmiA/AmiB activator)